MNQSERSRDVPILSAPVRGVWRVVNSPGHARFAYDLAADDIRPFAGNYVIIDVSDFYVFLAHMRSGSVRVDTGDKVMAGQVLGEEGKIVRFN
jgi:murein DD-endopeptidase MepM/ murein hydrolase activator NlpD